MKTAILLGATGLTGGKLLRYLLEDERYKVVKLFSRSTVDLSHPKLEEHLGDLTQMDQFAADFKADELFCCIGTTKSKTPNKELYRKIDYGIPKSAADLAKQKGIETFIVISALGADPGSSVFYNRTKGEMEEAVLKEGITKTHILQPSLIGGERDEKRMGEWIFKQVFKALNVFMIGPLKKYRSIKPYTIAKAMVWLANNDYDEIRIESDEIEKITQKAATSSLQ